MLYYSIGYVYNCTEPVPACAHSPKVSQIASRNNVQLFSLSGRWRRNPASRDRPARESSAAADHAGVFLNGLYRPQVRIDATQHSLSAPVKMNQSEG